jgi:hypothetical protein
MSKIAVKTLSIFILLILVLAHIAPAPLLSNTVSAAPYVQNRSLKINSSVAGAPNVKYEYSFDIPNISSLGGIKLMVCSNSPLREVPCNGFSGNGLSSVSNATITGVSGFVIDSIITPTQTEILLSRPLQAATASNVTITLDGITNPETIGTYYGRILLFDNSTAAGDPIYEGGLAFSINRQVGISAEVPPYLYFCAAITISGTDCSFASDSYFDFGELSKTQANTGKSQFSIATNAGNGYGVTYYGTTMTSGNNIIAPMSVLSVSNPGTAQFGINLRHNTSPQIGEEVSGAGPYPVINNLYNQPNRFYYSSGDSLLNIYQPTYSNKYTVSYLVNVPNNQAPGYYSTSILFVALANF